MKWNNIKLFFYVFFVSFVFVYKANAIIIKSLSLDVMIEKSKSVYIAQVMNVSPLKVDADGLEYNLIQLKVVKAYKESMVNELLEFKQVSQNQSNSWKYLRLLPIPNYKKGQKILFFMSEKSQKGYQMPIGFEQGKLLIEQKTTQNINDATIELKENHKNLFQLKANKLNPGTRLKTQKIKNKRQGFTVKDFEELYRGISHE
ncbi:hypothetical protein MRY82_05860 [bacterium]|nr:hypothetical protein [bacterium]